MAIIKCKMCGGDLDILEDSSVCECKYCGTRQTVPSADSEKKLTLFNRAGRLLRNCEFDKAAGVFETIIADFPEEAEAYWGLVLCRYGIEYVDDPTTGKKIPTCHRSSFESVEDDINFEQACENADSVARSLYREEARQIETLRQRILEVSGKEEPYDVFISYKELDADGERTPDSVIAQEIHRMLTKEGYRVFFSRISLEGKLGVEYEPYIFAALNSAKVMIVVGTDYEYFDAVWVKNEWGRFLKLIASGQPKTIIPVYKDMDPYDMPKELRALAAQNMGKIGAMQDLLHGVEKLLVSRKWEPKNEVAPVIQQVISGGPNTAALLQRGMMGLEDREWESSKGYFNRVLDSDARNANAYLGLYMAEKQMATLEELEKTIIAMDSAPALENRNFERAVRFSSGELEDRLNIWENNRQKAKLRRDEIKAEEKRKQEEAERIRLEKKRKKIEESRHKLPGIRNRIAIAANMIDASNEFTVGLKSDGFVKVTEYTGTNTSLFSDLRRVEGWHDIVAVSSGNNFIAGLKSNGTVIVTSDQHKVKDWCDIIAISAASHNLLGLKSDGTVMTAFFSDYKDFDLGQFAVGNWRNIISVAAGSAHSVGLKADGTVIATQFTGDPNNYNYCGECEVDNWEDIVAIAAGDNHTVGLKADGSVIATTFTGDKECNYGQCEVSDWEDIVAIAAGDNHTVGLKADGTVITTAITGDHEEDVDGGQCEVGEWRDVVAIAAGTYHTVAIKSDGTVIATKFIGSYNITRRNVEGWKLFTCLDTIEDERRIVAEKAAEKRRVAEEKAEAERLENERKAEQARIAAEKAAEEARIAAEKAAEEARIAAEKAAKKRKKIIAIAVPMIIACIAIVIVMTTVIIPKYIAPKQKYNKAVVTYGKEFVDSFFALNEGDTFSFGSYEQDNDTSNGKEDVEWLVLAKDGDKVLLISKYALDCKQFNNSINNTTVDNATWETCSLRGLLNGVLFWEIFNKEEQKLVQSTVVKADINPEYTTSPGNNTMDHIFLLSITEANMYFSSDGERKCQGTDYCYAQGTYKADNGNCCWWLRTPGRHGNNIANVSSDGTINYGGRIPALTNYAIRPAIWIDLGL